MKPHVHAQCILFICLLLAACAPKTIIHSQSSPPSALPGNKAGQPQKALSRYSQHIGSADGEASARAEAWRQSVNNAITAGQYDVAESNLLAWKTERNSAPRTWPWLESEAELVRARQGKDAYTAYLAKLINRTDLHWDIREAAGMALVEHFWNIPEYSLGMEALGLLHKAAPDQTTAASVEAAALSMMEPFTVDQLQTVLRESMGADPNTFPWSMVVWTQNVKQLEQDKSVWPAVWPSLSAISRADDLANKDFFANNLRAMEQELGMPAQNVALLLPLSGPYGKVGWRIAKGADTAWRESMAQAAAPKIQLINTESPTFLDDMKKLQGVPIIGGPLRKDVWQKIRLAGLTNSARFMTFMPGVEDEGVSAWRFFSSPADQARAVIQGSRELGVSSFAILYPQDRFGLAMKDVFLEQAAAMGVSVPVLRGYDEGNPPGWTNAVADLLGTTNEKNRMNPDPPFQAVYLPDSLSRVQQLAPMFHYFEETRLLLLGPQFWTQSVSEVSLELQYFDLTMFPGAWNPDKDTPASRKLQNGLAADDEKPDLWTALGYDFVRFCSLIGGSQATPSDFNHALILAENRMSWSLAPMHWHNGVASQDLFLFQPTTSGMTPANMETMEQARAARMEKRRQRIQELVHPNKQ